MLGIYYSVEIAKHVPTNTLYIISLHQSRQPFIMATIVSQHRGSRAIACLRNPSSASQGVQPLINLFYDPCANTQTVSQLAVLDAITTLGFNPADVHIISGGKSLPLHDEEVSRVAPARHKHLPSTDMAFNCVV